MTKVVLINQEQIPQYRVTVYNRLSEYLERDGYALTIISEGIPSGNTHPIDFDHRTIPLSVLPLVRLVLQLDPDVIIYWVRLRHLYLFPIILLAKILRKKLIYWGHGTDLSRKPGSRARAHVNSIEYWVSDALILYADHLKSNVGQSFHHKVFVANNTLCFDDRRPTLDRRSCLAKYDITTMRNIICTGRMQRRKRLDDLFAAFKSLDRPDVGLILVGPDTDGILRDVQGSNIFKLGAIYSDDRLDLLAAADVFCLPGAVGLSIVDAFYCGLPIVTEDGDESPEVMYLKPGTNGFVVPRGDIDQLAAKLRLLLDDDALRARFATAARHEIMTNGHVDKMCEGFRDALRSVSLGRPS